ncbi:MAG: ECF transporter S component [Clostridia bacterium]|nr:ECF transporter S component [Clostridia bacterium]
MKKTTMSDNTYKLALTAVFSALVFIFTFFVKIPVGPGYIHIGDSIIYLFACLVGGPWAMAAGALGATLADLVGGYAIYAPFTAISKPLIAIPLMLAAKHSENGKIITVRTVVATLIAALITALSYFIADLVIARAYAFADIPRSFVQSGASTIAFIIFGLALQKVKIPNLR